MIRHVFTVIGFAVMALAAMLLFVWADGPARATVGLLIFLGGGMIMDRGLNG